MPGPINTNFVEEEEAVLGPEAAAQHVRHAAGDQEDEAEEQRDALRVAQRTGGGLGGQRRRMLAGVEQVSSYLCRPEDGYGSERLSGPAT